MAANSLGALLRETYGPDDIRRVQTALEERGTLAFARLPTGLFPAATVEGADRVADRVSGYQYVWSRDNVYVGWSHFTTGRIQEARDAARALLTFYSKYRNRFDAIIAGDVDPQDVNQRPHVRFDGESLTEISSQRWSHAQNDALGYVLWYCSNLLTERALEGNPQDWETLALFPKYLDAIRYWEDEDSGHWEEARKISASSIGVVVAGLDAWVRLLRERRIEPPGFVDRDALIDFAANLATQGRRALGQILPSECVQLPHTQNRRYDAALLFLAHPLHVLPEATEVQILEDCEQELRGEIGIRRYLGDSYWAPDYDLKLSPEDRTRDFSSDMETRNALLPRIGLEAQWCIFDSVVSAYFGDRYKRGGAERDRERQTEYLNRALQQVTTDEHTPAWRCPELYYLKRGIYTPNPHVPLQWAQANLVVALHSMRETADMWASRR